MITRTVEFTEVRFLYANLDTKELLEGHGQVSGDITKLSHDKKEKIVSDFIHNEYFASDVRLVSIESENVKTALFGISEHDFMANAVELDPVTRKPLESSFDFS